MQQKIPSKVKVIYGILIFKLLLSVGLIILFYFIKDLPEGERSIGAGMRDAIISALDKDNTDIDYLYGALVGTLFIPILATILSLVFVRNRMFVPLVATVAVDLILGFSITRFPVLQVITLALIFSEPAKSYLKKIVKEDFDKDFGKPDQER